MKKIGIMLTAFAIFTMLLAPQNSQAEGLSFENAYQDYQQDFTSYKEAVYDYEYAKRAYLANSTLSLKEEARLKTLNLLKSRDKLLIVYLNMLRAKISKVNNLVNEEKNLALEKIDREINWYKDDQSKYQADDTLDILFGRSEESKSRYKTDTSKTIRETLSFISLDEGVSLRVEHENLLADLRLLIDSKVAEGKLTLTPFDQWFNDIDLTNQRLKQNEENARIEIGEIDSNRSDTDNPTCEPCTEIFSSSTNYLLQYNKYLTEVLNYIKNQQ